MDRGKFARSPTTPGRRTASGWPTTRRQQNGFSIVYLYSTADKKITAVTNDLVNSNGAVFDPDGNYFYFLSDRDYNEVLGNYDFEFANPKTTRPYLITLHADAPSPFPALSDETAIKNEEPAAEAPNQKKKIKTRSRRTKNKQKSEKRRRKKEVSRARKRSKDIAKNFRIDLEGIQNRIVALPVPPPASTGLGAAKDFLFYSTQPIQGLSGPLPGEESAVHAYDFKERKDKTLIEGIDRWAISFDGTKILYAGERYLRHYRRQTRRAQETRRRRAESRGACARKSILPPSGSRCSTKSGARSATISSKPA